MPFRFWKQVNGSIIEQKVNLISLVKWQSSIGRQLYLQHNVRAAFQPYHDNMDRAHKDTGLHDSRKAARTTFTTPGNPNPLRAYRKLYCLPGRWADISRTL